MDKQELLLAVIKTLESTLANITNAALIAKEAATSEESKAENKYDTRGLEASYLAGAQAKLSDELKVTIHKLSLLKLRDFQDDETIALTALIRVLVNEKTAKQFFMLPGGGGTKVNVGNQEIQVITPESVVGQALLTKKKGDLFDLTINGKVIEYEILGLS